MRSRTPTIHCDADDECPNWDVDFYEANTTTVGGVRITTTERAPGWRSTDLADYCADHKDN